MVNLLQKNPRLKFLLPFLFLSLLFVLYSFFLSPQLTLRDNLQQEILTLESELIRVQKTAGTLSPEARERKIVELQTIKENLGVGLDSPELVLLLEKKARENSLKIKYWSFRQEAENEEIQKRNVNLVLAGKYASVVNLLAALEAYPAFSHLSSISLEPGKNDMVEAYLGLSFSTIPQKRAKKSAEDLPLRDNPFK